MTVQVADRTRQIVDRAVASAGDIATLPEVIVRIIEVAEDPEGTSRDLHDVIQSESALSARVLSVVNSAFYGLPGQVAGVDRAIILLGPSAIKNIAIAAWMPRLFKDHRLSAQFSTFDLWRHSVAVAVAARAIAKCSPHPAMTDEIFVAGLIHDVGALVEHQAYPDEFTEVIERCSSGDHEFVAVERELIGADHQAFGVGLTAHWNFPNHLRAAAGFHHHPESLGPDLCNLATLIQVADIIACQQRIGFYLTGRTSSITEDMLDVLSVTHEQIEDIRESLIDQVRDAEQSLGS